MSASPEAMPGAVDGPDGSEWVCVRVPAHVLSRSLTETLWCQSHSWAVSMTLLLVPLQRADGSLLLLSRAYE